MTELDLDALRDRLSKAGIRGVRPLAGGASSLTFAAQRGGTSVVVKVAPPGHAPTGHRDVLRQARILAALSGTEVPVPELLWQDAGAPPLFVMSRVPGECMEPLFDPPPGAVDPTVRQRFGAAAGILAALHRHDPGALGLGAEPVVDAAAEIDRWCATLDTVDTTLAPGWAEVAAALRADVPPAVGPAVVHGDFRLGNLLADGPRISAVIDWEIWSVGDPRIDVGWFLVNADPRTYRRPSPYAASVPPVDDLAGCYADALGAQVPDLQWFMALACFKSTATWALIVKHNRRRARPHPDLEAMARELPHLLARSRALLG
ncbi:phosphotransferase family protein [Mycobacterium sp. PS03-16]|uniref:phosphotransferase family protein n=1 Tax=Mycobacterium sp. PS03-16 TaxID=2559611 RepID=UPI0010742CB2|nr:phosphotransferase family protein [Mycobacterium sp. PS03-16]TFV60380.1 phosphotransferase family protein [Mycobacterium sp. PS03-16]